MSSTQSTHGVGLDKVSEFVLLTTEERLRSEPIPRRTGLTAVRAALVGRLRAHQASGDEESERDCSIQLAQQYFDEDLDIDEAVRLLHRALEIRDDRRLRLQLAEHLVAMARHIEAGHVLRVGQPHNQNDLADSWLRAGRCYSRGNEPHTAAATFREIAMLAPDDPRPLEQLAAMAYWTRDHVPPVRAADAWLEAAVRHAAGGSSVSLAPAQAFEVAPHYPRAAEALAGSLLQQGREGEADEAWRQHAAHLDDQQRGQVAFERTEQARARGSHVFALAAALDGCLGSSPKREDRDAALVALLEDPSVIVTLDAYADEGRPLATGIAAAACIQTAAERADALAKLARRLQGGARAVLLAAAAESYEAAGNHARAHKTATRACAVAPWLSRSHAALIGVDSKAVTVSELEVAVERLPAQAAHCAQLAERLAQAGQMELSLLWSRRALDLRPNDLTVCRTIIERAVQAADPDILEDAFAVVLEQACPLAELDNALSVALMTMHTLDPSRAAALSRRVLAMLGPPTGRLGETMLDLATTDQDFALVASFQLRRAISPELESDQRAPLYLAAMRACLDNEDIPLAAEHLRRAASLAAGVEALDDAIAELERHCETLQETPGDLLLAIAEARAWRADQQDDEQAAQAWRELAALRWDLGDEIGAEEALFYAATQQPDLGPYRYVDDLLDRAGIDRLLELVRDRVLQLLDAEEHVCCGRLMAAAARVANEAQRNEIALELAVAAVQHDPSRGDAVAIVDKVAEGEIGVAALHLVYDILASASLGRYGARAAHYRAARQLEKRGAHRDALRHAIQAFEVVPNVGASYRLLLRLAQHAGDEGAAVRTVAGVASSFPLEGQLAWLQRAADLTDSSSSGHELRFELLLKAFRLRPSTELVDTLAATASALAALSQDEDLVTLRLERAVSAAIPSLNGLAGARTAVQLGVLAATTLGGVELCVRAALRALAIERHEVDFTPLLPLIDIITSDRDAAGSLLRQINELRADTSRPLGSGLKEITAKLYLKLSDVPPPPSRPPDDETAFMLGVPSSLPPSSTEAATVATITVQQAPLSSTAEAELVEPDSAATPAEQAPASDLTPASETPASDEATSESQVDSTPEELPLELTRRSAVPNPIADQAKEQDIAIELTRVAAAPASPKDEAIGEEWQVEEEGDEQTLELERPKQPEQQQAEQQQAEQHVEGLNLDIEISQAPNKDEQPLDLSPASERNARERGDYPTIAKMLAARADECSNTEQRRLIRLRLAAVLEQRLDRLDDACAELERVLAESGEDVTALRYLADLRDRQGLHGLAAKLWLRASRCVTDLPERLRDIMRCCEALLAADKPDTAKKLLDATRGFPQSAKLLRLRIAVARRVDDQEGLAEAQNALEALGSERSPASSTGRPGESLRALDSTPPEASAEPAPSEQAPPTSEPTTGAREPGQEQAAKEQAAEEQAAEEQAAEEQAAEEPQDEQARLQAIDTLEALRMDYQLRGPGTPAEARSSIKQLRGITERLDVAQRDLHTFLLVELLDAVQGTSAAMHELQGHWEKVGQTPLVCLAVAERLVRKKQLRRALDLYERALDEDLQAVRSRGRAALDAADAAHQLGNDDLAARYLERATQEADTRFNARKRHADWFGEPPPQEQASLRSLRWASAPPPEVASKSSSGPPESLQSLSWEGSAPAQSSSVPGSLAWSSEHASSSAPVVASRAPPRPSSEPIPSYPALPSSQPISSSEGPISSMPAPGSGSQHSERSRGRRGSSSRRSVSSRAPASNMPSEGLSNLDIEQAPPTFPPSSQHPRPPGLRKPPTMPDLLGPKEEDLFKELIDGSYDAGEYLVSLYERERGRRTRDVLSVRRYQARLRRGDRGCLASLRSAARADNNVPFARAIDHVLAAFNPDLIAGHDPPPLEDLPAQSEATTKLLFGGLDGTVNEALGLVCATGMMRRDISDYSLAGTDRVVAGASTPSGRIFGALSRLLELDAARMFHRRRSTGPLRTQTALLTPLSTILVGSAEHYTPMLRYVIGHGLAAATSQLALVTGLGERRTHHLLQAMIAAFGPARSESVSDASPEQLRIAEDLWHVVGGATERRLRELCVDVVELSYDEARDNAHRTQRRVGLFSCGDLVTAAAKTVDDLDLPVSRPLRGADTLRELCTFPQIADLFDLSLLPEYAEARWRRATAPPPRR